MLRLPASLTRAALLAFAWVFLLTYGADASTHIAADLDGDGVHDTVTVHHHAPSDLHIWLSSTQERHIVRHEQPIVKLLALDLDGDRRLELIAHDADAKLQIWTNRGAGYLRHTTIGTPYFALRADHATTLEQDTPDLSFDLPTTTRVAKAAPPSRFAPRVRGIVVRIAATPVAARISTTHVAPAAQRPPPSAVI